MPTDYDGNPLEVGDVVQAVCVDSRGGLPLYATGINLRVARLGRTRVQVEGGCFNGTLNPRAEFLRRVYPPPTGSDPQVGGAK